MGQALTKASRSALECFPVEFGREVSEEMLRGSGVTKITLFSLQSAELVDSAKYANGRFWRITDAGRAALGAQP